MNIHSLHCVLIVCLSLVLSATCQDEVSIGVLEEWYGPSDIYSSEEDYHLGIRPVFYWHDGEWKSYQPLFEVSNYNAEKKESALYAARRDWHLPTGLSQATIVSKADPLLPGNIWLAVPPIIAGQDAVPEAPRSYEYAGWMHKPVRPPLAVSSVASFPVSASKPAATVVTGDALPPLVVKAGYEQLLQQHKWWNRGIGSPPPTAEADAEFRRTLTKASKFAIEKEKVSVYEFAQDFVPEWTAVGPPVVCEDQESGEAWPLREGLKLICAGDFNLDGTWEYLFWIDSYNENGYLLASDRFRKVASYSWTYH